MPATPCRRTPFCQRDGLAYIYLNQSVSLETPHGGVGSGVRVGNRRSAVRNSLVRLRKSGFVSRASKGAISRSLPSILCSTPAMGRAHLAKTGGAGRWAALLARPQPAERSRGKQSVNQSVDHFLDGHAPGLPSPNTVAHISEAVGEERGRPDDAKDG